MKADFSEKRQTMLESIGLASATLGAGMSEFLSDKEKVRYITSRHVTSRHATPRYATPRHTH